MRRALTLGLLVIVTLATAQLPQVMLRFDLDNAGVSSLGISDCNDGCSCRDQPAEEDSDPSSSDDCPDGCPCRMVRSVAVDVAPLTFALLTSCRRVSDRPVESHGRTLVSAIDHPPRAL